VAQLTNRQRATIGGAVAVFLGALIAAAALAQSTRNQSDPNPTNGQLFAAAASPSPTVTVSPSPVASPRATVTTTVTRTAMVTSTRTAMVTSTATATVTSRATVTTYRGTTPSRVNAGTGGQAFLGGLSPGASILGMTGVSVLAVGSALMTRRRTGARL